jgi:surfeit locus 1 family protein
VARTVDRQSSDEQAGVRGANPNRDHPASRRRGLVRGGLAALFVLLVAGVCVSFGFWQLDRLEQRRAQNAVLLAALDEPVLTLDAATAARVSSDPEMYRFRRVRVRGRYEPVGEMILRGRSHAGQPGVHLLAPLRIDDTPLTVLVNRGWLPASDAATVDPRPYAADGIQEIEGLLQPYPAAEGSGVAVEIEVEGFRVFSLSRLDFPLLAARSGGSLQRFYLQELPGDAGERPLRLAVPEVSEGSHLSYAIQWFSFAAIFLIGFVIVATRRARPEPFMPPSDR